MSHFESYLKSKSKNDYIIKLYCILYILYIIYYIKLYYESFLGTDQEGKIIDEDEGRSLVSSELLKSEINL